jgi:hypothetical protein
VDRVFLISFSTASRDNSEVFKRTYFLAIIALVLIPAFTVFSGLLINAIDPEIAAGSPDYERNFRLLTLAKGVAMFAAFLAVTILWFLTCFFIIQSKQRSYGWLSLGALGPLGLIVLMMLRDQSLCPKSLYDEFVGKLEIYQRITYEIVFFVIVWVVAYQAMVLKRDIMIMLESARTGVSTGQIIDLQNASSGMWAFSEGLEVLFFVGLFYLLWPICFNLVGRLPSAFRYKKV